MTISVSHESSFARNLCSVESRDMLSDPLRLSAIIQKPLCRCLFANVDMLNINCFLQLVTNTYCFTNAKATSEKNWALFDLNIWLLTISNLPNTSTNGSTLSDRTSEKNPRKTIDPSAPVAGRGEKPRSIDVCLTSRTSYSLFPMHIRTHY